jgi:hypothetical protein
MRSRARVATVISVATMRGDELSPVATMIHQNPKANDKNNYRHHP